MLQVLMCVGIQCDQCGDILDSPEGEPGHGSEHAACVAAKARRWRGDPGGRWWCSACALVLTCQDRGHEFTQWRPSPRGEGAYRYCQRCCVLERRGPNESPLTPPIEGVGVGVLVLGEVA
jgi:hypothetical protein